MTVEQLNAFQEKLDNALSRIQKLEDQLAAKESPVSPWLYLVARPHAWRRQLAIKGRNMTAGQLASVVRANRLTPEQASEDLDLPVEAVREALAYCAANQALIELEAGEERRRLAERG